MFHTMAQRGTKTETSQCLSRVGLEFDDYLGLCDFRFPSSCTIRVVYGVCLENGWKCVSPGLCVFSSSSSSWLAGNPPALDATPIPNPLAQPLPFPFPFPIRNNYQLFICSYNLLSTSPVAWWCWWPHRSIVFLFASTNSSIATQAWSRVGAQKFALSKRSQA